MSVGPVRYKRLRIGFLIAGACVRLEVLLRLFFSVAIFRGKVFLVLFAVNVCRYFPHLVGLNAAIST